MKETVKGFLENKAKTMPILSFPSAQLTGVSVNEIVTSSASQKEGMKKIAERCPVAVSLSMMDLSVEAEAFGAKGYRAKTPEEFDEAMKKAMAEEGTVVIEAVIEKDEFVLPMLPPGGSIDDIIVSIDKEDKDNE